MRNVLNENVLVLNRLWQAINVCTVERAFMLLYMGHAEVVTEDSGNFQTFDFHEWREFSQGHHGEDVVHTVSFKIRIPRVILLLFFDRLPHKEVKFTRHNIFERDHNMCQYCGKHFDRRELNLDHIVPRDHGGTTTWENIVCACIPCNTRKANRTPAGMKEDEAAVYDLVTELHGTHKLSDENFARAKRILGEQQVVDLTAVSGTYVTIAMLLAMADESVPEGKPLPFQPNDP